jgi:hypothetical protein
MAGKLKGTAISPGTISISRLASDVSAVIAAGGGPKIVSITYPDDDTAANTTGGQSIIVTGTGFNANVKVFIGNISGANQVSVVTRANSNSLSFVSPELSAGVYSLYIVNEDGGSVTFPRFFVSGEPNWVNSASLGQFVISAGMNKQLEATSDSSVVYTLANGSSLPVGTSLASNGLLSGTLSSPPASETTYNFSVVATDQENQSSERAFSYTGITFTFTISPAVDGNSNIALTTGSTFAINANGFYTLTPLANFDANVQVWGAGGGGAVDGGYGGGGGYTTGIVSFESGVSYNVVIGSGGVGASSGRAAGGGGAGSGIRFTDNTTAVIVAGGGGGGWASGRSGGGGGGTTGQTGQGPGGGPGGTQSAAGVGLSGGRRTGASGSGPNGGGGATGSAHAAGGVGYGSGGVGAYNAGDAGSGGGGGGYWGGAEGGGDSGGTGGGGGSGYFNTNIVSSGYTETGALNIAAANSSSDRSGAGTGGLNNSNRAANGRIVFIGI